MYKPGPLVSTIRAFSGPIAFACNSNNRYVYVTNYGVGRSIDSDPTDKVSAMDSSTNKIVDAV